MTDTTWRGVRGSREDRRAALVVAGGPGAFVGTVHVVVVLGGGVLIGQTSSPSVALSILATTIVALGFEPVRTRLDQYATQVVRGGRPAPYDVLSQFSTTVSETAELDQIPARMARLLAEGTGAVEAQVWLVVRGRQQLAASWPPSPPTEPTHPPTETTPPAIELVESQDPLVKEVRQAGELLGVLVVRERQDAPLGPAEHRLYAGLASQAGLVLHGARLRAELQARASELSTQAAELQRSRQRLVDAHDAGRRRLERDIHDGAQQHLVALTVNLRLAQTLASKAPERARDVLADQDEAVAAAIDTLADLSTGIYPSALTDSGLSAALRAAVASSPVPVTIHADDVSRHSAEIESTLYFCALEAIQNATKHAAATSVVVGVTQRDAELTVRIEDNGVGFAPVVTATDGGARTGAGLANMQDRAESVGGNVEIRSAPGEGTTVVVRVPSSPLLAPATPDASSRGR